tara:strand:- start:219 stop:809 length:591 start_codon:yes stop_codon:yes gene_type:complete
MRFEQFGDAIVELNGMVNPQFLKLLIDYADKKCVKMGTTKTDSSSTYRTVKCHTLSKTSISDSAHFLNIQNEITKAYSHYKFKFPQIHTATLLQVDLLKYEVGGGYFYHTDDYTVSVEEYAKDTEKNAGRILSVTLNLNDDYEGGDMVFGYQNLTELRRIKMKSGTLCFFPSNFLYPHKIERITKGTRYSVVAWLG